MKRTLDAVISLTGLCIVLLGIFFTGGFYYEGGEDPFFSRLFNGYLTGAPEHLGHTLGGHVITGIIIKQLYISYPGFEWYDAWSIASMCLAYLIGAYWLVSNIGRQRVVVIVLFSLIMFEHIKLLQITKTAFFLSFFPLVALFLPARKPSIVQMALLYTAFAIGSFTRSECGFLAAALIVPVYLIGRLDEFRKAIQELIKPYLIVAAILVVVGYLINTPANKPDEFYFSIRPHTFTLWDWEQKVFKKDCPGFDGYCPQYDKFCPENKADSVILMAAQSHFLFDTSSMNKRVFDKLCVVPIDKTPFDLHKYFSGDIGLRIEVVKKNFLLYGILFLPVLIWIILTLVFGKMSKIFLVKMGLAVFLFFLTITAIAFFMKTKETVMIPLVHSLWITSLYLWFPNGKNSEFIPVAAASIFALLLLPYKSLAERIKKMNIVSEQLEDLHKELNRLPDDSTICFDAKAPDYFHSILFKKYNLNPSLTPFSFDCGFIYLYPSWQKKAMKLYGSDQLEEIIRNKFRFANRSTYFVFNNQRYRIYEEVSRALYGTEIFFTQISLFPVDTAINSGDFKIYTLR